VKKGPEENVNRGGEPISLAIDERGRGEIERGNKTPPKKTSTRKGRREDATLKKHHTVRGAFLNKKKTRRREAKVKLGLPPGKVSGIIANPQQRKLPSNCIGRVEMFNKPSHLGRKVRVIHRKANESIPRTSLAITFPKDGEKKKTNTRGGKKRSHKQGKDMTGQREKK